MNPLVAVCCEVDSWWVTVVQNGAVQRFLCHSEEAARRFAALFSRPAKAARPRARSKPALVLPRVQVTSLRWG